MSRWRLVAVAVLAIAVTSLSAGSSNSESLPTKNTAFKKKHAYKLQSELYDKNDVFIEEAKDPRLQRIVLVNNPPATRNLMVTTEPFTRNPNAEPLEPISVSVQPEGMSGVVKDGLNIDTTERNIMEKKLNRTLSSTVKSTLELQESSEDGNISIEIDSSAGVQKPDIRINNGDIGVPSHKHLSLQSKASANANTAKRESSNEIGPYEVVTLQPKPVPDEGAFDFVDTPLSDEPLLSEGTQQQTSRVNVKKGPNGEEYEYEVVYYYYYDDDNETPANGTKTDPNDKKPISGNKIKSTVKENPAKDNLEQNEIIPERNINSQNLDSSLSQSINKNARPIPDSFIEYMIPRANQLPPRFLDQSPQIQDRYGSPTKSSSDSLYNTSPVSDRIPSSGRNPSRSGSTWSNVGGNSFPSELSPHHTKDGISNTPKSRANSGGYKNAGSSSADNNFSYRANPTPSINRNTLENEPTQQLATNGFSAEINRPRGKALTSTSESPLEYTTTKKQTKLQPSPLENEFEDQFPIISRQLNQTNSRPQPSSSPKTTREEDILEYITQTPSFDPSDNSFAAQYEAPHSSSKLQDETSPKMREIQATPRSSSESVSRNSLESFSDSTLAPQLNAKITDHFEDSSYLSNRIQPTWKSAQDSTISLQTGVTDSFSSTRDKTILPDNSPTAPDNLSTMYSAGLTDKAAHDLYAIVQQTQEEELRSHTDSTAANGESRNQTSDFTTIIGNSDFTRSSQTYSSSSTTSTTTPIPSIITTTTSTTTITTAAATVHEPEIPHANFGGKRFRGSGSKTKIHGVSSTTENVITTETEKVKSKNRYQPAEKASRPAYGRRGQKTSSTQSEPEASTVAVHEPSKSGFTPKRYRANASKPETTESTVHTQSSSSAKPSFAERYNAKRRGGLRSTTPNAVSVSQEEQDNKLEDSSVSEATVEISTTSKPPRTRGSPRPLRPGPKLNLLQRGRHTTTTPTSTAADVDIKNLDESVSDPKQSDEANRNEEISNHETTVSISSTHLPSTDTFTRLRNKPRIKVSEKSKTTASPPANLYTPNQNRRQLLLPRKRQQHAEPEIKETEELKETSEEVKITTKAEQPVSENVPVEQQPTEKTVPEVSSTTENKLNSLLSSRRRNLAARKPGNLTPKVIK